MMAALKVTYSDPVDFWSMSGEFDATLQWPAKFTITLQLLNQHRDQDHITVTTQFQWKKPERERVGVDQSQQQVERIGKLEKQLKEKEQELEQLNMKLGMPLHFTMSNFKQLKTENTYWNSLPMYTHTHGYKFCIGVWPNGVGGGRGTHVSVVVSQFPADY